MSTADDILARVTYMLETITRPDGPAYGQAIWPVTAVKDLAAAVSSLSHQVADLQAAVSKISSPTISLTDTQIATPWKDHRVHTRSASASARGISVADEAIDNRAEMALDVVREYVASHGQDLWCPHRYGPDRTVRPPGGWIGRHISVRGTATVAILPERLRDTLRRAGYTLDAVLAGWRELGYLHESGTGRAPYLHVRTLDTSKARIYIFTPDTVLATTGDGDGE